MVESTGAGNIILNGTSESVGRFNDGVQIGETNKKAIIRSVNGNIILNGDQVNGTGEQNRGIVVDGGSIVEATGTGSITLKGFGGSGTTINHGIFIVNGAMVQSSEGTIILNGTGGNGTDSNHGILIQNANSKVSSISGNISLIGTGGDGTGRFNHGIFINNGGAVETTGTGQISLMGIGSSGTNGAEGIRFNDSFINPIGQGSGTITLTGDEIQLDGTTQIGGKGILQLQPFTPSLEITIGGTTNDTNLNLNTTELDKLQNGLSQIIISHADADGVITLKGDATFKAPVLLQSDLINHTDGTLIGIDNATIMLEANQAITTGDIINPGRGITLTSGGTITTGILSTADGNKGGDITIVAPNDINTGQITTFLSGFTGDSGSLRITSSRGNITSTDALITASGQGKGGGITLNAPNGSISVANINARSFTSTGGEIQLNAGNQIIASEDIATNERNITFGVPVTLADNASVTISGTGNITFNDTIDGTSNLTLDTDNGIVQLNDSVGDSTPLNNLRVLSDITTTNPDGIDITIFNNIEIIGNITSPGGIDLTSINRDITAGILNSSNSGDGGDINLDALGNIIVSQIDTQSLGIGRGGNVNAKAGLFFQATDSFPDQNNLNASISTAGGAGGGTITIRHGGGGITPFIVGNAETNGTSEAITRGNTAPVQTISPTQEYLFTHKQDADRIQIISVAPPPQPPQPDPNPLPPPPNPDPGNPSNPNPIESLAFLIGDILGVETQINHDPETGKYNLGWPLSEKQILSIGFPTPPVANPSVLETFPLSDDSISSIDQRFEGELEKYFDENFTDDNVTAETLRETLKTIEGQTGKKAVVVYALSYPEYLELVLVLPEGSPIRKIVPQANAKALEQTLIKFRRAVTEVRIPRDYLTPAQQLYNWMIAPLESELQALGIDTLIFCMDAGLRLIPMAALHDGEQFLVEKYSIGSIPSVSLTNSRYNPIKDIPILAMGASKFRGGLSPLPAVPVELELITQQLGSGQSFLNPEFTVNNLKEQRQQFRIIHLATHGEFQAGTPDNSYIQLWGDEKLRLDQLRQMDWHQPPQVELLVLSACRTALGDRDVELGFAGLAVQAGVKSALASLWYVSDGGTLALMSEFYHHLSQPDVTIKAEALRRAQIALLRGEVKIEAGQLMGTGLPNPIPLPPELLGNQDFSHPYYWAAFTMIGSPW